MTSYLVADLTAFSPGWVHSDGSKGTFGTTFCLPWFREEPPLVGQAAQEHRRASDIHAVNPESRLDPNNRGRWHWAEGWLALTAESDTTKPISAQFEWTPYGRDRPVGLDYAQALAAVLSTCSPPAEHLGLVVPAALGSGPRERLLRVLQTQIRDVLFIPRPMAAALPWCNSDDARRALQAEPAGNGKRVGDLLVATCSADRWELVRVPIRAHGHNGQTVFCPVHDRVRMASETGTVGIAWLAAQSKTVPGGSASRIASWLKDPAETLSVAVAQDRLEEVVGTLDEQISGICSGADRVFGVLSKDAREKLLELLNDGRFDAQVFAIARPGEKVPQGLLDVIPGLLSRPDNLYRTDILSGAAEAMRRFLGDIPPYYEALAPLELRVEEYNEFHDPRATWVPLLEVTDIGAGKEYVSPRPIRDQQLPGGNAPSIDLDIRTKRLGKWNYRRLSKEIQPTQELPHPVEIKARMRPGAGLARVEIKTSAAEIFRASIDEGHLETLEREPELRLAWPIGNTVVIPVRGLVEQASYAIRRFLREFGRGAHRRRETLGGVLNVLNQWKRPADYFQFYDEASKRDIFSSYYDPDLIDKNFVYLGSFPSHGDQLPDALEDVREEFVQRLMETLLIDLEPKQLIRTTAVATWLYSFCSVDLLNHIRKNLGGLSTQPGIFNCAGNCFRAPSDHRRFFHFLLLAVQRNLPPKQYWLKAYRNLARLRENALSFDVLDAAGQTLILDWYLELFRKHRNNPNSGYLGDCIGLAPHILKRRRFDRSFLELDTPAYAKLHKLLELTSTPRYSAKHQAISACAIEFLEEKATPETLVRLSQADTDA